MNRLNMKQYIKALALVLLSGMGMTAKGQQNIQFTQYIFNSMSVNPAYTGYKEEWFGQLGLRSQWVGLDGAPKTGVLSVDGIVDPVNKRHGVGVQLTADKLGPQSASSAYLNYAFRLRLNEEDTQRLSFGVGAGVTQYSLNGTMLRPIDNMDATLPPGRINNFIPDIRFGVYYYAPKWYAGVSVMDLLSGDQSNNIFRWDNTTTDNLRRKRHMYFMGGALIDFESGLKLRPSLLVKEDFKGPTSVDVNAMFIFDDRFWIGAGWRTGITVFDRTYADKSVEKLSKQNALAAIVQLYVTPKLRVGYSYDYILSQLNSVQNGSHEITLGITFGKQENRLLSPRFF